MPALNESALIDRCLDGLRTAIDTLAASRPDVTVEVVVVLDRCTDDTPKRVAARAWVSVETVDKGVVGHSRAHGVLAHLAGTDDPRRTWILSTDADSEVPPTWIVDHLDLADQGHELVLGVVRVDPTELTAERLALLDVTETVDDGHDRIYGANLGFRLDAYLAVGGFPDLPAHEDVALATAFRRAGRAVHASGSIVVLTSARLEGRTPAGFAAYLRGLGEPAQSPVA